MKIFKVKDGDKNKNSKFISLLIYDEKLLEKCKTIWNKIEDLKNIKLNTLSVYVDSYIKTKIRAYGVYVYANCCGLNEPEDDIE